MIYVDRSDETVTGVAAVECEGEHYAITDRGYPLPYELQRKQNRPVVFADAVDGRAWWNTRFPEYPLAGIECIDVNQRLEYYGFKHKVKVGHEDSLQMLMTELPPVPKHAAGYMLMENWLKESGQAHLLTIGDGHGNHEKICGWLAGGSQIEIPWTDALYGYGAETLNKIHKTELTQREVNDWIPQNLRVFWLRLHMAACIAMDSTGVVTVALRGGATLALQAVQVRPGVPALRVALPCGAGLFHPNAGMRGHVLVCGAGKPLSQTRLMKHLVTFIGEQMCRAALMKELAGVAPPAWVDQVSH